MATAQETDYLEGYADDEHQYISMPGNPPELQDQMQNQSLEDSADDGEQQSLAKKAGSAAWKFGSEILADMGEEAIQDAFIAQFGDPTLLTFLALNIYVIIGLFSKNPVFHLLTKLQEWMYLILDMIVAVLIFTFIVTAIYLSCNTTTGKIVGLIFFPSGTVCKSVGF